MTIEQVMTLAALIALVAAGVIVPLAIADSAERFGDELRKWADGEEEDDDA
jgi:hypothetical protein